MRRSVFRSGLDWMMTVAPATGRPVGLSTVPPRDRPVSITPETAKARRSAARDRLLQLDVVGMGRHELELDVGPRRGGQGLGPPSALVVGDRGGDLALRVRVSLASAPRRSRADLQEHPGPRDRPPSLVAHGAADRHPALQGHHGVLGDRLVSGPSQLDGRETGMDDDDLEESGRPGRYRDRGAPLLVGRALRDESPIPSGTDPDRRAG